MLEGVLLSSKLVSIDQVLAHLGVDQVEDFLGIEVHEIGIRNPATGEKGVSSRCSAIDVENVSHHHVITYNSFVERYMTGKVLSAALLPPSA